MLHGRRTYRGPMDADLEERVRRWIADDPDPATSGELEALLAGGEEAALVDRFGARLTFGTAGIRGALGAGPARMNRALVRRVAAGLAASCPYDDVIVGCDARRGSAVFADDICAVLAGAGLPTRRLPGIVPTPVLAYAVRHLGCDGGVMVTASHNPPGDNGLKVYGGDGAQIVPPTDQLISEAVDRVGRVSDLPLGEYEVLGDEVLEAYLEAAAATLGPGPRAVRLVHTAMHGVGTAPLLALLVRAGFPAPLPVAAQAEPDPAFPTVAFPNPEEPGALDLGLREAALTGADALLATDPDADRLAVAVPDGAGGWRVLTGDELGVLLGDHVLATTSGEDRLVVSTVVSSTQLARVAAAHGAQHATTLTGFKWIVRAGDRLPGARFVYGYEEALGYAVAPDLVRDKDGLTAALVVAEMLAADLAAGRSLLDRLDDVDRRSGGASVTRPWTVRADGPEEMGLLRAAVERLAEDPPAELAGRRRTSVERPADDVVVLHLEGGARAVVRPSGTEPKLKCYLEVVVPAGQRASAGPALDALRTGVAEVLGLAHS